MWLLAEVDTLMTRTMKLVDSDAAAEDVAVDVAAVLRDWSRPIVIAGQQATFEAACGVLARRLEAERAKLLSCADTWPLDGLSRAAGHAEALQAAQRAALAAIDTFVAA